MVEIWRWNFEVKEGWVDVLMALILVSQKMVSPSSFWRHGRRMTKIHFSPKVTFARFWWISLLLQWHQNDAKRPFWGGLESLSTKRKFCKTGLMPPSMTGGLKSSFHRNWISLDPDYVSLLSGRQNDIGGLFSVDPLFSIFKKYITQH